VIVFDGLAGSFVRTSRSPRTARPAVLRIERNLGPVSLQQHCTGAGLAAVTLIAPFMREQGP
jgi:hypothetical protein